MKTGRDYPRAYEVYVSSDGTNWGSAIATGTGRYGITDVYFTEQTKQYIKIIQTESSGNYWSIEELNVYADTGVALPTPTPAPTSLARTGWTLSGNGINFSSAIDNDSGTFWTTNAVQENGQYLILNMGSVNTFTSIRMDASTRATNFPRAYEIYVSNDGTTWGSAIATGSSRSRITDVFFTSQTKQYIKIVQTVNETYYGWSNCWWSIGEMNVYFDNIAPTTQNTVFASNITKRAGYEVAIASSGCSEDSVWFAPVGTTVFSEGATMTKAAGNATSIIAPATEGTYRMFVIDAVGNCSAAFNCNINHRQRFSSN